jgi:hypothetical protein
LYFGLQNTNQNQNTNENKENNQAVLREICAKWSKFSDHDVSAFKGNDDLVNQVVAKYGLEHAQARVDALLKGRQIGGGS